MFIFLLLLWSNCFVMGMNECGEDLIIDDVVIVVVLLIDECDVVSIDV